MLLDFETRSAVDLKVCGAYRYARDASTEVLCLAWGPHDAEPELWTPADPFPADLLRAAEDPAEAFHAHNAIFERLIWNHVLRRVVPGLPELGPERFDCTLARAAASGWPLRLEALGVAMGLEHQKDPAGSVLLRALTRVTRRGKDGPIEVPLDRSRLPALYDYCKQDHRAEAAALARLPPLSKRERDVWLLDQKINDRGVCIDVPAARAMQAALAEWQSREDAALADVTGGAVEKVSQAARLLKWVQAAQPGLHVPDLRKERVAGLLAREDLRPEVEAALLIRADAGGTATRKIAAMLAVADPQDHRARGLLQYHGANTGRWAGRLIQPQNFPRPTRAAPGAGKGVLDPSIFVKYQHDFSALGAALRLAWGSPFVFASDMLRPLLIAGPGRKIVRGDLSAIEARVLLWLAGHDDAMAVFRSGACLYCETAAALYGRPVVKGRDDTERQVGKIIVLGCGYQMGPGRYQEHAAANGVFVTAEEAEEHVTLYRTRWWRVPRLWRDLERCAWAACTEGGVHSTNGCDFVVHEGALVCRIPSGRWLRWQQPGVVTDDETGEKRLSVLKPDKGGATRRDLYGGLIAERVTQALARDVMVHAMFLAEAEDLPVILSVHDELLTEPLDKPDRSGKLLTQIMSTTPGWLAGCPLAAECAEGDRYGK